MWKTKTVISLGFPELLFLTRDLINTDISAIMHITFLQWYTYYSIVGRYYIENNEYTIRVLRLCFTFIHYIYLCILGYFLLSDLSMLTQGQSSNCNISKFYYHRDNYILSFILPLLSWQPLYYRYENIYVPDRNDNRDDNENKEKCTCNKNNNDRHQFKIIIIITIIDKEEKNRQQCLKNQQQYKKKSTTT